MTLVYQAYGREDIIRQSLFSVLTFLRWKLPHRVLVYTDQTAALVDFFAGFPQVEIVGISPDQIKRWRGAIDFVHRVKIEVLLDAVERSKDSILYLDGDTVFLKNPEEMIGLVGPGQSVMHIMESRLDQARDPLTKKMAKFCRSETFALQRGTVAIPLMTEMWNAGVIGLHVSRAKLLEKILELTDVAYARYQKHVIEQLAVSYFLQSTGKVMAASPWVLHYWQTKEIWQARIDTFLRSFTSARQALAAMAEFDFSIPAPPPKKSFFAKLFG